MYVLEIDCNSSLKSLNPPFLRFRRQFQLPATQLELLAGATLPSEMVSKKSTKRVTMKMVKKGPAQISTPSGAVDSPDFLPLAGGPGRKILDNEEKISRATVLYIGRIPHGFYEAEMEGFFKQFGAIKRLRIARNRKTGKSKHFGFIEFASPEVARVVADCMHNYLLFEHLLKVQLIPPEKVHPRLWSGVSRGYKPLDWVKIERKRHDKERTLSEHNKMVEGILKRDKKRRERIKAAEIDYECPELVGVNGPAPKKIRFNLD